MSVVLVVEGSCLDGMKMELLVDNGINGGGGREYLSKPIARALQNRATKVGLMCSRCAKPDWKAINAKCCVP